MSNSENDYTIASGYTNKPNRLTNLTLLSEEDLYQNLMDELPITASARTEEQNTLYNKLYKNKLKARIDAVIASGEIQQTNNGRKLELMRVVANALSPKT